MKGDLHAGHLSASFSSLSPQFPQIGTFMTGLNEDIRLDVFSDLLDLVCLCAFWYI